MGLKHRMTSSIKKHNIQISRTNGTEHQPILITITTLHHHTPLLLLLLVPLHSSTNIKFNLTHHLTAPMALKTRQEADAAAALTRRRRQRQPLKQYSDGALLQYPHHLLRPADVPPTHKQSGRDEVAAASLLHQLPQLISKPSVHRDIPLAHRDPQTSDRRSHRLAVLESFTDAPQARGVENHPLVPLGRAQRFEFLHHVTEAGGAVGVEARHEIP